MEPRIPKLKLNKQTVRTLGEAELRQIEGGSQTTSNFSTCQGTCNMCSFACIFQPTTH